MWMRCTILLPQAPANCQNYPMSQIDRLHPFLLGPVTIPCPKMAVLARDFEPLLAEGEGQFEIVSEREFRYRMTGRPVDLKHSLRALNRPRNEPYNAQNKFRLVMTDADGMEWSGGWTVPEVNPDAINGRSLARRTV